MKQREDFENREKQYKLEIENKEKEIIQLQTKIAVLNKNKKNSNSTEIKKIYINGSSGNKTNINYNQEEMKVQKKNVKNEDGCISYNSIIINNINQRTMKNFNINDNISLFYKHLNYGKNNNEKKTFNKNNSSPNIFLQNDNDNDVDKKKFISNYLNKINNEQSDNIASHLLKKKEYKYIAKDNSFINPNNINIQNYHLNYSSKNNLKKVPFTNINNNIESICLNTSLLGNNLNLEKFKVQQKLLEYKKLIDKKKDELMKEKKIKVNSNINRNRSCEKIISPKSKFYKKISKVISSSDYGRNRKKSDSNFIKISNENLNSKDKITIVPKRINNYEQKIIYNPILNKDNLSKNKIKKIVKNNNVKGKIYLDSYNEMMNKKNIY